VALNGLDHCHAARPCRPAPHFHHACGIRAPCRHILHCFRHARHLASPCCRAVPAAPPPWASLCTCAVPSSMAPAPLIGQALPAPHHPQSDLSPILKGLGTAAACHPAHPLLTDAASQRRCPLQRPVPATPCTHVVAVLLPALALVPRGGPRYRPAPRGPCPYRPNLLICHPPCQPVDRPGSRALTVASHPELCLSEGAAVVVAAAQWRRRRCRLGRWGALLPCGCLQGSSNAPKPEAAPGAPAVKRCDTPLMLHPCGHRKVE
jgi:hypothetical protein